MTTTLPASPSREPGSPGREEAAPEPGRPAVPEVTRRRLSPLVYGPDPWSWVATGVVTVIAAIVRLVGLDRPGHIIFDETYYAPNAYGLLQHGVEWNVAEDGANPVDGAPVLAEGAAYVVHPPLGKWLIALGELIFGYDAFGWRIAAAVAGIASVLLITRIARRLFGSTMLGAAAGLLMALDGMHLVMSRTALLDIFLLFFLVAAFGALLLDRDTRRQQWLTALESSGPPHRFAGRARPAFTLPWWRFAAAGLLGCALAVKWSAIFFIPVFALLVVIWEVGARRSAGVGRPWRATFVNESGPVLLAGLLIPVVYVVSWTGWFLNGEAYHRNAPVDTTGEPLLARAFGALRNLYEYHHQAFGFHSGLDAEHVYESSPWQWLLLGRPVAFHWSDQGSCGSENCASAVLLLGTPLLWWSFLPALALLVWIGLARRDWRAVPILLGVAAGIVPWFFFDDRVMFYFYALPSQPFLVLAVVYVLGAAINPSHGGGRLVPGQTESGQRTWRRPAAGPEAETIFGFDRRVVGTLLAGAYVTLIALTFAYFYPIYTAQVIPYEAWQARMWLSSWI